MEQQPQQRTSVTAKYGGGGALDDTRRKREETTVVIRKQKREEALFKRRNCYDSTATTTPTPSSTPTVGIPTVGDLPLIIEGISSAAQEVHLHALVLLRKLLSLSEEAPIDEVLNSPGAVQRLVQLMATTTAPQVQFEACWCLTNLCSGTSAQTSAVVQAGSVPYFVALLASPHEEVREQAVWAIGNIAGDSVTLRDYALQCGVMPPLIHSTTLITPTKVKSLRNAVWALGNLVRGKPAPPLELVRLCIPVLAGFAYHSDVEVLSDTCWALSYITDGAGEPANAVIDAGICRRLVELLSHSSHTVFGPAVRVLGNIASGDELMTQTIINVGALHGFRNVLMTTNKKNVKKEVCWALSNVTAGTRKQVQAVIDSGVLPALIDLMDRAEFEIKKEAAWAVCNICSIASVEQVRVLVSNGVIGPLCNVLGSSDPKICLVALEGIENILAVGDRIMTNLRRDGGGEEGLRNAYADMIEEVDGLGKIELLQTHLMTDISNKATTIIEKFYQLDDANGCGDGDGIDEEGDGFLVTGPDGQQTFSFPPQNQYPPTPANSFTFN